MACSRFCGYVDDSPRDTAKLREVIVRLNLELLNVIDDGSVVIVSQEREIIAAVEQKHVASVSLPVDSRKAEFPDRKPAKSSSTRGVLCHTDRTYAGRQCEKLGKIAPIEGQIDYE